MKNCFKDPIYINSFFIFISSFINAICGFIFWILAGRLYSVHDVGIATALISSMTLVGVLSKLGFDVSVIRFYPNSGRKNIIGTSLVITTVSTVLIGLIYLIIINESSYSISFMREPNNVFVFFMAAISNSLIAITGNVFIASRRASYYFYQNALMALRIPLLIPLSFLGNLGIFGSFSVSALMASIWGFILLNKLRIPIKICIDYQFIRMSLRFSLWNYVSGILSNTPINIIPILILNILGEEEAAKYYIAYAISSLVLMIPSALSTSLFVEGSHGKGLKKSVKQTGIATFALLFPAVLVIFMFGKQILNIIRIDYVDGLELLQMFSASSFLVAVYSIFISIQNVRMRVENIAWLNILRFMLLLGLSYLLISTYGINGAGYAWVITYAIIFLVIIIQIMKDKWI